MPIRPENKARYPKNWKEIRERIRTRAEDRCEGCGVRNHSSALRENRGDVYEVKIICTVAHLDHTPENCDDSNLRFWCQRCHNIYDAPMRAEGRKNRRKEKEGQCEFKISTS